MSTRVPLIAGNWKMNHGGVRGVELAAAVARKAHGVSGVDIVVAPPFTAIAAVSHEVAELAAQLGGRPIGVAAQNVWFEPKGAFTGEVSVEMLLEAGASWVIVGHSERRTIFGESNDLVAKKARAALTAKLSPIICVGETLAERESGRTLDVVLSQLDAVTDLVLGAKGVAVIAYEPVWAIGTGKVATPDDAQTVHAAIRARLAERDAAVAGAVRVLYGGSVNAQNSAALLAQPDIDGALVGGASLDADSFASIFQAAHATH